MLSHNFFSDESMATLMVGVVFLCLAFGFDDMFVDLVAMIKGLKPLDLSIEEIKSWRDLKQKRIAIMIANWHEAEVLPPMIRGNLMGLEYHNYVFFLGVYPNDEETVTAAETLAKRFPNNVKVVVNSKPGPTSKGQMLNEIAQRTLDISNRPFDLFLIQDSEDVLHRHSLSLLNHFSDLADFIQLPVFSFHVPKWSLVAGVYIDEFSEPHTKDLLVREHLGAAIPSAGVGTLISRKMMKRLMETNGSFLKEDTLTEDYHLGLSTKPLGFKSKFLCVRAVHPNGRKEFIATREFFPAGFWASVRQKTRWVLGIAFEGSKNIGWNGSLVDRYFMMRDRRGPINSVATVLATFILCYLVYGRAHNHLPTFTSATWFQSLIFMNLTHMSLRVVHRMHAVTKTHSFGQAAMVPIRWLMGSTVNVIASYRAYLQFRKFEKTGVRPNWSKTTHQLPKDFGTEAAKEGSPLL